MSVSAESNNTNQIRAKDRGVHDWYRFVLSFPPHLVQQYLDDFDVQSDHQVFDPFCGTGTTLVEARKLGFASVGVEANPMTHFACRVKTNWDIAIDEFEQHSQQIAGRARDIFAQQGLTIYDDLPLFAQTDSSPSQLRCLSPEQTKLLLSGSISPRPLHRALELLDLIRTVSHPWTSHQELALASTLVADASNLRFGPEVGVSRKKRRDADVVGHWLQRIQRMVSDLRVLPALSYPSTHVYRRDARDRLPCEPQSIHVVITSPPYPNEKDYTRTTRLESVILGHITTPKDLRTIKKQLLRSNTRNVYVADRDDQWGDRFKSIRQLADQIEVKRQELGKTSGFEKLYHRVVRLYFGGMYRHLESLKQVLVPGALCAYVVGDQESFFRITIRTGELLAEIAESCGFQVKRIDLWRTRLATATSTQLREEVVILQWPG